MDKRIYICAAIILLFALLALLAYNNLEIYSKKIPKYPSRKIYNNLFYAMEQWLNETGHPVRIENRGSPEKIVTSPETAAFVHAADCSWIGAEEILLPWIKKGNSLYICLDFYDFEDIDENLLEFLSGLGIEIDTTLYSEDFEGEDIPDFNWYIHFLIDENADIFTVRDNQGYARLAEVSVGEGKLTITGFPVFMYNYKIKNKINAALAWELTGARTSEGILFIYTRNIEKSFFGRITERGNMLPVIISALLVIIFGFWMVIPVFGLVFEERQKNSRPIRERFAAEFSFLKKYKALDYYLDIYKREHQITDGQIFTNISEQKEKYNYREIINKLRSVTNGKDRS